MKKKTWVLLSDDTAQLLNLVEQQITLLDDLLVSCRLVLRRDFVGRDDARDLVDRARQSSRRDESGKVRVKKSRTDAKRFGHAFNRQ